MDPDYVMFTGTQKLGNSPYQQAGRRALAHGQWTYVWANHEYEEARQRARAGSAAWRAFQDFGVNNLVFHIMVAEGDDTPFLSIGQKRIPLDRHLRFLPASHCRNGCRTDLCWKP